MTHDSATHIGACLDAAVATGAEVIVVDNASQDGTCAEVERRGVRLIANPSNAGFAGAVNQGIRALRTPLLLLLNPDAIIQSGLESLRDACDDPRTAAVGGMLVDDLGKPQVGFMVRRFPSPAALCLEVLLVNRLWPGNPVNWHYRCLDLNYTAPLEVEQPAGAFLMIRRDAWERLGGFDESFHPLWFEDVDFLKRAQENGYRICYTPRAVAKHTGGHSIRKISLEFRQLYWYRSLLKYAAKHFPPGSEKIVCLAVIIGSVVRTVLGIPHQRSLKPIAVYGKVVRLAGRQLFFGTAG
ncbi:MAG: glycosyltransferase family 2 protein [Acidobacteriia bacterium]|nr:glycosyltransferase family 2 protein [Terriglobia bacterium]